MLKVLNYLIKILQCGISLLNLSDMIGHLIISIIEVVKLIIDADILLFLIKFL